MTGNTLYTGQLLSNCFFHYPVVTQMQLSLDNMKIMCMNLALQMLKIRTMEAFMLGKYSTIYKI